MSPRFVPETAVVASLAIGLAGPAGAAPRAYAVDPGASSLVVHVGKTGVFGFAGHPHDVVAERFAGRVEADPDDLARSSVTLSFEAAALRVSAQGEPGGDAPKVQEVMAGPKVLDVARFPAISFRSREVAGRRAADGAYELQLTGELRLHGATRTVTLPVRVEVSGDTLASSRSAPVAARSRSRTRSSSSSASSPGRNERDPRLERCTFQTSALRAST
ncbi:MAG: hypothetical protein DMF81_23035 [Acidobacteria bacterium]|nr:MAG: hypothetical protein DMF81_23035 [Acidobacteriota bacterium]